MKNPLGYKCKFGCKSLLRSPQSRSNHYHSIHKGQNDGKAYERRITELKCPDCAKTSISLQGLKKHHKRRHRKVETQNFTMATMLSTAPKEDDDLLKAI